MGLLSVGEPLSHEETIKNAEHVRRHGIKQFINIYNKNKDRIDRRFKWGDELESMIVRFDHKNRKVRISLTANDILEVMNRRKAEEGDKRQVLWMPETGAYMLESTPGQPYGQKDDFSLFGECEDNMKTRRREIRELLDSENEAFVNVSIFPRQGTDDFTFPYTKPNPKHPLYKSVFVCEEKCIGSYHPRFLTVANNLRLRRGGYVTCNIPIFKDTKTRDPFREDFGDSRVNSLAKTDHIFLDDVVFGMGCCCLQVTMQAKDMSEAMTLYDQMTQITPVMMALSAATPILRGYLSDLDCRWSVIAQTIDDRTAEERGETALKNNKFRINKSRFDSIDSYLSESNAQYNDIPLTYDHNYYEEMVRAGVPVQLARHVAHQFIRDPCLAYREQMDQKDDCESGHFDNIWSTNWQTLRFKPPPPSDPSIGWRVEFRPMEIQSTDFENSAFDVILVLISRAILAFGLNLMVPISKVEKNFVEAQKRNAVNAGKFWFRTNISVNNNNCLSREEQVMNGSVDDKAMFELMSIDEIVNGKDDSFPGLLPLVRQYVDSIEVDVKTRKRIEKYIQLLSERASGRLKTTAQWMREFVRTHEEYKFDSVVNESICYDLMTTLNDFQNNRIVVKQLVGDLMDE